MSDVVQAHLNVCKGTILWHAQTHISTQWFRSDKSQYLWRTLWSFLNTQHDQSTQTSMQACYFLVYMGPYYCHIWLDCDIKVSMESGEHAGVVWAHMTQEHKLVWMHTMFLNTKGNLSANLDQIREIKVCLESGKHVNHIWAHNVVQAHMVLSKHAILGPIY